MGDDYARLQIIKDIAENGLSIIPSNIIVGGEKGGNLIENFMGIKMIETLTGKPFNIDGSEHKAPTESFVAENAPEDNATTQNNTPFIVNKALNTIQQPSTDDKPQKDRHKNHNKHGKK